MLPEISAQPNRSHEGMLFCERTNYRCRIVGTVIENEEDFFHDESGTAFHGGHACQRLDFI